MGSEIKANVESASMTTTGRSVGSGVKQRDVAGFGAMMNSFELTGSPDSFNCADDQSTEMEAAAEKTTKDLRSPVMHGAEDGASALASMMLQLQSVQSPPVSSAAGEKDEISLSVAGDGLQGRAAQTFAKGVVLTGRSISNQPLPTVDAMSVGPARASAQTASNLLSVELDPVANGVHPMRPEPLSVKEDGQAAHGVMHAKLEGAPLADSFLSDTKMSSFVAAEFVMSQEPTGGGKKRSSDEKSGADGGSMVLTGLQDLRAAQGDVDPMHAATGVDAADGDFAHQVSYWILNDVKNAEITVSSAGLEPVQVSISMTGNEARLEFRTGDAGTRDLIQTSLSQLEQMLKKEGVSLSSVSIAQERDMGASGGKQGAPQDQRAFSGSGPRTVSVGEIVHRPLYLAPGRLDLYV